VAVLGNTADPSSTTDTWGAGDLVVSGPFTFTEAGTITSVTQNLVAPASGTEIRVFAVYADNGSNRPGSLLCYSAQVSVAAGSGTADRTGGSMTGTVVRANGDKVHIGFLVVSRAGTAATESVISGDTNPKTWRSPGPGGSTPPDPFGSTNLTNGTGQHRKLWLTYTPGGGTTNVAAGRSSSATSSRTIAPARALRPSSDISDGSWTDQAGGASLYAAIDELAPDDTDYARSSVSPAVADTFEVLLAAGTNPGTSDDGAAHRIRCRCSKNLGGGDNLDATVSLVQGTTVIATRTYSNVSDLVYERELVLSDAEANAITDYTDLRLRFSVVKS
jgi:hypothetical protein